MDIFVLGYPRLIGGANTELFDTLKLCRAHGADVTLIPAWSRPGPAQRARMEALGCKTVNANPDNLAAVPGLPGAVVIAFCNLQLATYADAFRKLGCRLVWVGCMTYPQPQELRAYKRSGRVFDAHVFQSHYQRRALEPYLKRYGYQPKQGHMIRGAFDLGAFPFNPRKDGNPFVIGRLSRPAIDKFSPDTWRVYQEIADRTPTAARVMAWQRRMARRVGEPPEWVETLGPCAESPQEFLGSLTCLVQLNGTAVENWPRVGLEAMATGVPIIADNKGGWPEMIDHGKAGFLCRNAREAVEHATYLATNEPARMEICRNARAAVERLADPDAIWARWTRLFNELEN